MNDSSSLRLLAIGALLAWGVLSFGAVYPWAYQPLTVGILLVGAWMCMGQSSRAWRGMILTACLLLIPVLLQQTPLPASWIESIAPANARVREVLYVDAHQRQWLPLSVSPGATTRLLIFLGAVIAWAAGLKHALHKQIPPASLTLAIMAIATVVALESLIQQVTFNGKIYWFWESWGGVTSNYFGPFVNRNHFAGWMLLATAIGSGFFIGSLATTAPPVRPGLRERILWLGSRQMSYVVLVAFLLAIMVMSIIWSRSRSGAIGTTVMITVLSLAAFAHGGKRIAKRAAATLVIFMVGAAVWKGVDALGSWYADTATLTWRLALWHDSIPALQDFAKLGSGLNTYGTVMLLHPQSDSSVQAQQAHNDYLQLAIEGGLLVGIPVIIGVFILVRRISQRLRQPQNELTWWIRMGAVAGIAGMAVQELTEFSLQMPGVAVLFATLIAVSIHEPSTSPRVRWSRSA